MFNEQSYEVIKQRILDNINIPIDKREGSFLDAMVSTIIEEVAKAYIEMGDIPNLVFIEDTFDTFLDKRLGDFGVYRKLGKKATGSIKVIGKLGETIENGTILSANDLNFVVLNDIVLSDTDNVVYVEALEVGYRYNLLANTDFKLIEANNDITSLKNEADFKNGIDVENDEELRKRFRKIVSNPPTSGNKAHYEMWALECDGVGRATVYPLWDKSNGANGNGTVKILITGNDNKPVNADIITNVKNYIDEAKPIGCTLTVVTPTLLNISIAGTIELKDGYILEDVKLSFEEALSEYLKTVASELTYSKIYGILVNQLGVGDIADLTINNSKSNITILEDKLVNISSIVLNEVV